MFERQFHSNCAASVLNGLLPYSLSTKLLVVSRLGLFLIFVQSPLQVLRYSICAVTPSSLPYPLLADCEPTIGQLVILLFAYCVSKRPIS